MAENDYWYAQKGPENDVVISSRIRLSRNLVNFPFPQKYTKDDAERVETLLFDAFAHLSAPENFQVIPKKLLNERNRKIFVERGVLDEKLYQNSSAVIKIDGKVNCAINEEDHLKIASFTSGFDLEGAFKNAKELDDELQKTVQFAANYEFGFLTANIKDSGSGMKASVRVHLPSLTFLEKMNEIVEEISKQSLDIDVVFGSGKEKYSALGGIYDISTKLASFGSEADQIGNLVVAVKALIKKERKARSECVKMHVTRIYNEVLRAYSIAKFATLVDPREGIEILSKLKWGKDLKIISGIQETDIFSLLYGSQESHLEFLIKQAKFEIELDLNGDEDMVRQRVRSLLLRESLEKSILLEKSSELLD